MTTRWMTGALAIGAVAACCGGCTTYPPQSAPRVAEASDGYHRGAELIPHGFLDSGLVDAVNGNPQAEDHARKYRGLQIGGFVLDVAGLGLVGGGVSQTFNADTQGLGLGLVAGGCVLVLVGVVLQAAAGPAKLDALNIYNDGALGLTRELPKPPEMPAVAPPPPTPPEPRPPLRPARAPTPAPKGSGACTKDTECKGSRVCEGGVCVSPP